MKKSELNRLKKWQQNGVYWSMICLDIANIPTAFLHSFLRMDHNYQNSLGIFVKFWIIGCLPRHKSLESLYFQDVPVEILLGTSVWEPLVQMHLSVKCCSFGIVGRNRQLFLIRLNWAVWQTIWSWSPSSFKYPIGSLNYSLQKSYFFMLKDVLPHHK